MSMLMVSHDTRIANAFYPDAVCRVPPSGKVLENQGKYGEQRWKMCLQRYINEISFGGHITRKGDYKLGILICECLN